MTLIQLQIRNSITQVRLLNREPTHLLLNPKGKACLVTSPFSPTARLEWPKSYEGLEIVMDWLPESRMFRVLVGL